MIHDAYRKCQSDVGRSSGTVPRYQPAPMTQAKAIHNDWNYGTMAMAMTMPMTMTTPMDVTMWIAIAKCSAQKSGRT